MKKLILTAAVSLTLAVTGLPVSAGIQAENPAQEQIVEIVENNIINEVITPEIEDAAPAIPESKIARKMTQAEKAENAAVNDGWGGAITIIAMCIVLSALIVLSLLFMGFGKVSEIFLTRTKKRAKAAADHDPDDNHDLAPGEVIAAISLALSEHFAEGHDVEDTILTIRRLQKAYSPWNSKIYNLRSVPEHVRNTPLPNKENKKS